jgi:signal transduction histidine kinase
VIHSYAEGLQEGIAKEKENQYLSVILEQSEKMDGLVLQMLDFSRLEAGKVRLSTDNFSLLKLAQSITDRFQPLLEDKDLTLQYGVCQDFLITADEARIEQVITNLVSNALKYTEPGNTITVSVYQHDGKAGFSIENPGTWLTDEQLEKVWDSFFRADPSRSTPGTGLGLAVVKQIIQLHQGSCRARNMLYKKQEDTYTGVQFSFQIPLG